MAAPLFNAIKGTTSGTPGTGAFTPNAAATGGAYAAWSAVPSGWAGLVLYADGTAWERRYGYWNGTTITRPTAGFVDSSTGSGLSLSSSATASLVVDAVAISPHMGVPFVGFSPNIGLTGFTGVGTGVSPTITGTATAAPIATTNYLTERPRVQISSATTANSQAALTYSAANYSVVSTAAGRGGFEVNIRFGASQFPSDVRAFLGMTDTTYASITTDPSAHVGNYCVVGRDSADTNLQLIVNNNSGSGTKTDTGIPLTANGWYEARIWANPGSNTIYCLLVRKDTGDLFYGSTSTDVPVNGALLFPQAMMKLASTTGTPVDFQLGGIIVRPCGY